MNNYIQYIIPVAALTALAAGWMAVQLLARKMKTKNLLDDHGGCCGACDKKESCSNKSVA